MRHKYGANASLSCKTGKCEKDLLEWSTGDVTPGDGEIAIRIEYLGVNAVVSASLDRRVAER